MMSLTLCKIILFILFLILNSFDYYLTVKVLEDGGRELNPIIKRFGLLPPKIVGTVLAGVLGYIFPCYLLIISDALLAAICVWNLRQHRWRIT